MSSGSSVKLTPALLLLELDVALWWSLLELELELEQEMVLVLGVPLDVLELESLLVQSTMLQLMLGSLEPLLASLMMGLPLQLVLESAPLGCVMIS
jgi:hypothetical protein